MKKEIREQVYRKYDGHCAYCGKSIEYKDMQVDHIEPAWHNLSHQHAERLKIAKGSGELENYNPSCRRCNKWKSTYSVEAFRREIEKQVERLQNYHNNFRLASDYGLVEIVKTKVVFYFETIDKVKL